MATCQAPVRCALLARAHQFHQEGEFSAAALLARQAVEARLRDVWLARGTGLIRNTCPLGRLLDRMSRQGILPADERALLFPILKRINRVIHSHGDWSAEQADSDLAELGQFLARVESLTEGGAI